MNMRGEIILNVVNNSATFSPSSWDWRQYYTEVPWYVWIVSRGKPRMTFKSLLRPQRIPKAETHHRLRAFGRIGNGCIVQIIILWSDIYCSYYSRAIANVDFWMGKGSGSAVPETESTLDKVLTLLSLWTLNCSCLQSFATIQLT